MCRHARCSPPRLCGDAAARTRTARTVPVAGMLLRGVLELLRMRLFRRVMLVSALVLAAMRCRRLRGHPLERAGVTPAMASVLWSESVGREVIVFFLIGSPLVKRLSPAGVMALRRHRRRAALGDHALTTDVMALAMVQPAAWAHLRALHLACMRLIAAIVPQHLAATAQAIYALGGCGDHGPADTRVGRLYARLGAEGFLVMGCSGGGRAVTLGLRSVDARPAGSRDVNNAGSALPCRVAVQNASMSSGTRRPPHHCCALAPFPPDAGGNDPCWRGAWTVSAECNRPGDPAPATVQVMLAARIDRLLRRTKRLLRSLRRRQRGPRSLAQPVAELRTRRSVAGSTTCRRPSSSTR